MIESEMTFAGTVTNGVVVLPESVKLADGTRVVIQVSTETKQVPPTGGCAVRNGVPLLPAREVSAAIDLTLVNRLRDAGQ